MSSPKRKKKKTMRERAHACAKFSEKKKRGSGQRKERK